MASIVELCRKRLQWRIYLSDKQECPEAIRLLTLAGIVTPVVATSGSGFVKLLFGDLWILSSTLMHCFSASRVITAITITVITVFTEGVSEGKENVK